MPEYDRESGSRRIYHIIELLQDTGYAVTFYADNMSGGERYARVLQQQGVMVFGGLMSQGVSQAILVKPKKLLRDGGYDIVIIAFWYLAEKLLPAVRAVSPHSMVIVDSIDVHFLRLARKSLVREEESSMPKTLSREFASEMLRELNTYLLADGVLTVSRKEANLLNDFSADESLAFAVPDLEEWALSPIPASERKGVLFVGNFRHTPNVEAAEYFLKKVVPLLNHEVLRRHPIYIVGNELPYEIQEMGRDFAHVRMVGWVPSLLPYLERSRVSVAPLLHGAGTKRKVIESLLVGTPVVATSIANEGLALQHEEHVLEANTPQTFAEAIERLLEDNILWERLQANGRSHITNRHNRSTVKRSLERALEEVSKKEPLKGISPKALPGFTNEMAGIMDRAIVKLKQVARAIRIRAQF